MHSWNKWYIYCIVLYLLPKWYIRKLLKDHIGKKLAVCEGEFEKPIVHQLEAELSTIYTIELMKIP